MQRTLKFMLGAAVLLSWVASVSADEHQTAKTVMDFLKPFEGFWANTAESEGEVVQGVWTVKPSAMAPCFLTYGGNTATGQFQSLDGYDPVAKKWTAARFRSGGEFSLIRYEVKAEKGQHYGKGTSTPIESTTCNSDGTTTTRKSTMTCLECNNEGIVLQFTGRTESGEPRAESKLTMKRQLKQQQMPEPPAPDVADAQQVTAQDYMDFLKPFVGSWKTKVESGGEVVEGTWSGYLSPVKNCYVTQGTAAGKPSFQGIDGYDAGTKKWTVASYDTDGEFTLARLDFGNIKRGQRFGRGVAFTGVETISKKDGTTTKVTYNCTCKECSDREIVYVVFNRTENGKPTPDQTFRMERQAKR